MARLFRVHAPDLPATIDTGGTLTLDPSESHHVRRVLRLRDGDAVRVFDGDRREWDATVVTSDARATVLRLGPPITPDAEPTPAIRLFQGLCRHERMEWLLQKGTEVGISAFVPVIAERSDARPPSASRRERWRRILIEACKQSGRVRLPTLAAPVAWPPDSPGEGAPHRLILDPGARESLAGYLADHEPGSVWLAVGPESGFADAEIAAAGRASWQRVALGPRVLRTETAGLVAAALILGRWGDLAGVDRAPV